MKGSFRAALIKLIAFVAVAVVITISVVASLLDLQLGQPTNSYRAVFTNATGLQPGDIVRIAGVQVGKIKGVQLRRQAGQYYATVSFTVLASQHMTNHSDASIAFENLLGQRYLDVTQGDPGGAPLPSGSTIPLARTRPGLDLTTVFNGFQPLLSALNPQQVNELTGSVIAIFQGQAGAISSLVSETANFTSNLAARQAIIYKVLDNLTPLLTQVNGQDQQLGQLIDGFDSLVTGLAGQRYQIGNALTGLSNLTSNLSSMLANSQPYLDQDIAGLAGATASLAANQTQISNTLADLPRFLTALNKASDSGNYLTVYACDLTLTLSGPVSVKLSPTVPQSPGLFVPSGVIGNQSYHTRVCA
jgi:phospholipid/cholesterol/gamma-HCH transport system substrate-binding protein